MLKIFNAVEREVLINNLNLLLNMRIIFLIAYLDIK